VTAFGERFLRFFGFETRVHTRTTSCHSRAWHRIPSPSLRAHDGGSRHWSAQNKGYVELCFKQLKW